MQILKTGQCFKFLIICCKMIALIWNRYDYNLYKVRYYIYVIWAPHTKNVKCGENNTLQILKSALQFLQIRCKILALILDQYDSLDAAWSWLPQLCFLLVTRTRIVAIYWRCKFLRISGKMLAPVRIWSDKVRVPTSSTNILNKSCF